MNNQNQLPSTEFSLKSVSWHLKVIAEEMKALNQNLCTLLDRPSSQAVSSNKDVPF